MERIRDIEERTIPFVAREKAAKNKQKDFMLFRDRSISYAELDEKTNRIGNAFSDLGIKKGDKVAILMSNCPEYILTWFGLAKIGAIEVPIYQKLKGSMVSYRLDQSDSKILVTETQFLETIQSIAGEVSGIQKIVVPEVPSQALFTENELDIIPFRQLLLGSRREPCTCIEPSDVLAIMYTSGSTGPPKGVMLPHEWALHAAENKIAVMRTRPEDLIYNCFPLSNPTGQIETTLTAMVAEAKIFHAERFSATGFWNDMKVFGVTEFVYMGGILGILMKRPENPQDKDHSVRAAWGAACPRGIWQAFEDRFHVKIVEIYGQTELMQVTQTPPDEPKIGSCGKVVQGYELKILDDKDQELGPNQVGEIAVRPTRPYIMLTGYYKEPERTLSAMRNLWWHTGDLGFLDEDGYLYFYQRKHYVMRIKGHMVSSWEIEQAINSYHKVLESVVFGIPSELGEEECKAIVVLKKKQTACPEEILHHCQDKLPDYMIPRFIEIKERLKKTQTGRVPIWEYQKQGIGSSWDRNKAGCGLRKAGSL